MTRMIRSWLVNYSNKIILPSFCWQSNMSVINGSNPCKVRGDDLARGWGSIKYDSDRDKVREELAQGGWDVYYGDVVELWEVAIGILGTVISGGVALPVWAEWQISAQLAKFGQSLDDIKFDLLDQVIQLLENVINNSTRGEWDIGGFGIKAGVATYHKRYKVVYPGGTGQSGWNDLPSEYQPYIGFRLANPIPLEGLFTLNASGPVGPLARTFPAPPL